MSVWLHPAPRLSVRPSPGVGFPPSSCRIADDQIRWKDQIASGYCHAIPLTRYVPTGVHRRKAAFTPISPLPTTSIRKKIICRAIQMQFKTPIWFSCARKIACRRPSTPRCVTFTPPAASESRQYPANQSPAHVSAAAPPLESQLRIVQTSGESRG